MSVMSEVIFWWCATCGSIWGVPTQPMPDTFDADMQRLRVGLQGTAARLARAAPDLERIPASVFMVDNNGHYVAVNDKACELTGYSRAELLGKSIRDLTPPHAFEVYERLWDGFVQSTKQHGFYQISRKDGSVLTVKYCAYMNLAPGIHISFITAS
jgi:PAS domain S-box-containing protein